MKMRIASEALAMLLFGAVLAALANLVLQVTGAGSFPRVLPIIGAVYGLLAYALWFVIDVFARVEVRNCAADRMGFLEALIAFCLPILMVLCCVALVVVAIGMLLWPPNYRSERTAG